MLQLYIEGQRVELFKDENVTMTSSVQNIKALDKVFTDYIQSFTVPASSINNRIFKHWAKPEIVGGFDARERKEATIELSYMPFKEGKIELNKVQKKNGEASSYTLTFYGNIVKLTDLFGEDLLTDLNLNAYIHDFDSANVKLGIEGTTLESGDVIYPLLSSDVVWEWGTTNDADIKHATAAVGKGLVWNELKPALRLQRIFDAIKTKYSISFSDDFFNSADFLKLYMWASREKGKMKAYGEPTLCTFSGTSSYQQLDLKASTFIVEVTPQAGYETVPYTIILDDSGVQTEYERIGTGGFNIGFPTSVSGSNSFNISIFVKASEEFQFVGTMQTDRIPPPPAQTNETTSVLSATGIVYFSDNGTNKGQLPKIKVIDFFTGIIKMFNLTVVPTSPTSFNVQSLNDWYDAGEIKDFTRYADMNKETVIRPKLHRVINFNYKEPKTILQNNFNGTNAVFYGDLEHENNYDGGTMDIKLPFENVLLSKISDNNNVITDVSVGTILDKELDEVSIAPFIFYLAGNRTLDDDLAFINDSGTKVAVSTYNVASQENALTDSSITNSLNWGSEISSYTLTTQSVSLFSVYWSDYISDLYDERRREFEWDAFLPSGVMSKLQLNDKIVINNRRYIINSMNLNLNSGKTRFQLLNDLSIIVPLETTNNGLQYELQSGLEQ